MWVKLHTKLLNWEWYSDINTTRLFIHCLLKANYKDKEWKGITIKRGSFVTSLPKLSEETGLTVQQTRTSLDKLILTNNITNKSYTKYRVISIVNYESYQENNSQNNKQITDKQQTEQQQHQNIEYKNILKKEKINKKEKKFIKPTLEELKKYIQDQQLNVNAEGFIDYYEGNGWKVGRNSMKDWKATVRNWSRRQKPTIKIEETPSWYGKEIKEETASEEEIKKLEAMLK